MASAKLCLSGFTYRQMYRSLRQATSYTRQSGDECRSVQTERQEARAGKHRSPAKSTFRSSFRRSITSARF